jgi:hypothetical protein
MKIVMVGKKNGKRNIRWTRFLGLTTALASAIGLWTGFLYWLVVGEWKVLPVLLGVWGAIIMSGTVLAGELKYPLAKLPPLD